MASLFDWSSTAASNTSVDSININTGMSPGNVDNALRSIMALVRNSFSSALQSFLAGTAPLPVANGGTGTTTLGNAVSYDAATAANFRANTADKLLVTDDVWSAAAGVALTDGATITPDFSTGFNFTVTLAGNRTLANPTNAKAGQSGVIEITQDGTGSRTLAFGTNWLFQGGTDPTLTTTASAKDLLFYQVLANGTSVFATLIKGAA